MGKMSAFNNLTPAQAERLALLAEELGEAVQIVGKCLRHGFNSFNPDDPRRARNWELLQRELDDVLFAIELLCVDGDLYEPSIEVCRAEKARKVWDYLHHQRDARLAYYKRHPLEAKI